MKKSMVRSDLASEVIWRPKWPQIICLKKSGCYHNLLSTSFRRLSQSSSVKQVSGGYLNLLSSSLKAKYPKETAPLMAAAGLLGPDLVCSIPSILPCVLPSSIVYPPFSLLLCSIRSRLKNKLLKRKRTKWARAGGQCSAALHREEARSRPGLATMPLGQVIDPSSDRSIEDQAPS